MANMERLGRPPTAAAANLGTGRPDKKPQKRRRLPDGTMSRSYHVLTTPNRLIVRIRPIEEKRERPHEYRNSNNVVGLRFKCDWCTLPREAAIHHF